MSNHAKIRAALVDIGVPIERADEFATDIATHVEPQQYTRADLKSMSPDQIEAARVEGRLDAILRGSPPPDPAA